MQVADRFPSPSASICRDEENAASSTCAPHLVWLPHLAAPLRDTLFLYLPGTNNRPDKQIFNQQTAVYAGFRTIGLSYDNRLAAVHACGVRACGDDCYGKVREEIFLGQNRHSAIKVKRGDAILERLYNLLRVLHEQDLTDDGINDLGWDAYFVPRTGASPLTGANIVWSKVIVAGFSEGGNHAMYLSKRLSLRGAVDLDGNLNTCIDPITMEKQPADWVVDPFDASAARPRFGVGHVRGVASFPNVLDAWSHLGLGVEGDLDNLDDGLIFPPPTAAFTNQQWPKVEGCGAHLSMAKHACMPIDAGSPASPNSATAATCAGEVHLFSAYLMRFCCADHETGCR